MITSAKINKIIIFQELKHEKLCTNAFSDWGRHAIMSAH